MRFLFFNEWKMYRHNGDVDVFSISFSHYYLIITVFNFTLELNFTNEKINKIMSKSSSNTGGISFMGALALIFIILKLTGTIDWSWWIVLLPLYGLIALVLFLVLVAVVIEHLMK